MSVSVYHWTDELLSEIQGWDKAKKLQTLYLERHPEYPTYLLVNSPDPNYAHSLKDLIGEYCAIHMLKLDKFYEVAEQAGYDQVVFLSDIDEIISWLDGMEEPYPFSLSVDLKKFQIHGFNLTKDLESAIINWSTGTGKSVYAVARAQYLLKTGKVDKVIVASKNHNKINWQRQFKNLAGLDAAIAESGGSTTAAKREGRAQIYQDNAIFIVNYEKFRWRDKPTNQRDSMGKKRPDPSGDAQEILAAIKGQRVLWVWDEMPSKMKKMRTMHFKGVQKLMKKTAKNYQIMLTATKIETDPENIYNCMKILDPTIWSSKQKFRSLYAKSMSHFSPWQVATWDAYKLKELGMRISHMTSMANKYSDPEIKAEFPDDHWEDVIIDMSPQDSKLYQAAKSEVIADLSGDYQGILSKMNVLQQICNNPVIVNSSDSKLAQALTARYRFTDKYCAKLETLKDMLDQIEGKVVLFSMYNDFGARMLAPYLAQWGHPFVLYDGNAKKKQEAEDKFRSSRRVKVFLSSDQGSDSINLEAASSVINYDLPWNYSTLVQRVNRISRLTSLADHVYYYNLITAGSIEERRLKVLETKRKMEEAVDQELVGQGEIIAGTTMADLRYILGV
jgi:SNF2 family DNA or RNA helicase